MEYELHRVTKLQILSLESGMGADNLMFQAFHTDEEEDFYSNYLLGFYNYSESRDTVMNFYGDLAVHDPLFKSKVDEIMLAYLGLDNNSTALEVVPLMLSLVPIDICRCLLLVERGYVPSSIL